MKRIALLFSVVFAACGPESTAPQFPIEFVVSAALRDDISAFQLSLVTNGSSLDCVTVQKSCIKDQVASTRFVALKDASGKSVQAVSFDLASLMAGSPSTQDVSLKELPVGKDFALIVEAVSTDSTPRLAGSSCSYIRELTAGNNAMVSARIEKLDPRAACDPRF
ncbi:MAG: hypothetical protein ACO1OB_12155 [Archangium sp.]